MDRAFEPKTVAIIGERATRSHSFLKSMRRFKGPLYSIQSDQREIAAIEALGIPNYTSLADVPEPVDYAIIAVSRRYAADVLKECIRHGVGGVSMYPAGYAETGTEEGISAQEEVKQIAREAGQIVLGPNCMGLHNPSRGVCYLPMQPIYDGGRVGFATQSGSHGNNFSLAAPYNGLPITKLIGFGNGVVLESADYLEYLCADPKTEAIALYVESLQDGPRFFRLLRETTPKKPVVVWKGGQTEGGRRAAASHTAALAESMELWRAASIQTGAIITSSLEETIDALKALVLLPRLEGDGCGIAGGMGGQSVTIADAFGQAGLRVPALAPASYERLREFFSSVGAFYANPIDIGSNSAQVDTIMDILATDPGVDILVMQLALLSVDRLNIAEGQERALKRIAERTGKPALAIPSSPTAYAHAEALRGIEERLQAAGIPSFPSNERAARGLSHALGYYRFLRTA